ncbi:hypothetical protein P7C70_g8080, partial [Phenoliferia sp. Uapishka_3]
MPARSPIFVKVPIVQLGNTEYKIPALGLGTWQSAPGEVKIAVEHALKSGYTHIDCAYAYANETEVGEGIRASGVKREDIFITSKLWCSFHSRVEQNLDLTLKDLGVDYLDLYLMHWPVPLNPNGNDPKFPKLPDGSRDIDHSWTVAQTWKQMEDVLATGKVKAIGVSNFSEAFLEDLKKTWVVPPAANQIELHPYLPQHALVKYLHDNKITPQAYSPLGSTASPLLKDPVILQIAEKYGVSAGTVLLSYPLARKVVALPKSVTPKRIEDNIKVIQLDAEDVKALNDIHKTTTIRFVKPEWNVDLKFDDW